MSWVVWPGCICRSATYQGSWYPESSGASLFDISALFAKEFIVLIALAFLVAVPVAYYFMHNWLENFAYHIGIGKGIFFIAVGISFADCARYDQFPVDKSRSCKPGHKP